MINLVLYEFVVWVGAGIDQEKVLEAIKDLFGSFARCLLSEHYSFLLI